MMKNASGAPVPTEQEAIGNITKEENRHIKQVIQLKRIIRSDRLGTGRNSCERQKEQEEIWLEGVTGGGSKEKRKDRK